MFFYTPDTKERKKSSCRRPIAHGFTLIEIVLAVGIFTIFFVSVSVFYRKMSDISQDTTQYIQSGFLLEEGVEAIKLLRDDSWSTYIATLTPGTTYYLYWTGTIWRSTTTPQTIENTYTRSFVLSSVNRDTDDNIATSGTNDPGTKKVVMTTSWKHKGGTGTLSNSIETYITNLFNN